MNNTANIINDLTLFFCGHRKLKEEIYSPKTFLAEAR